MRSPTSSIISPRRIHRLSRSIRRAIRRRTISSLPGLATPMILSGLSKLQYHTDGDVADVWTDIVNPADITVTLPNVGHIVGAYQSGKNKFYLRVVDGAGNASTSLLQEYYYSASAPTPPQNLTATPTFVHCQLFLILVGHPGFFRGG